ncbi:EAL domain-containing response regulator [Aquitalea aquatica]|uniref:EAL domain-containing protein n=1 Tax=Aquitalea aquatica TaxID=3044273 RepID=A0A838YGC6_9NEIS|nr:EAL domain-containing protein [Aquitalea magnusonii]MBA4709661.1 EAL domain-containing protein [Aquitalea magnusonii]
MSSLPMRLLILEDQVILRKLISRQTGFFSRHATQIDEFSDPAEALRSAAEISYDLIITDIGMPGMNGIDFIKNLSAIGCRSSLLIISGYDDRTLHTIAGMARQQGISSVHFLCKPYSIDQFLDRLNAVFADLEQRALTCPLDLQQLWQDCTSQPLQLEFKPVLSRNLQQLRGMQLTAMRLPSGLLSLDAALYRQLAVNPQLPVLILEVVMEQLAQLLASLPLEQRQHCLFSLYLDGDCLANDNLFDRYNSILRQYGVQPGQIGFLLADGMHGQRSALCFENIAKLKYFGFSLLADQLGEGGLTVGNLLRLPLDGVCISASTLRQLRLQAVDMPALLQCCGLALPQLTITGIDMETDLELLDGLEDCSVSGEQIALQMSRSELSSYLQQQTAGKLMH